MILRQIHKKAGFVLLALCLLSLCACSPSDFTSVIYIISTQSPSAAVLSPSSEAPPSPQAPSPSADSTPEPVLPPEPSVEPYDFSLPAPETEEVDAGWFEDAVFLGDSRTDGLRLYGGVTGADFICYKGLMCRDFSTKVCITSGEQKITAREALQKKQYGKVFVMLGLNELDFAVDTFAEDFSKLVDEVCETQPDAVLYFQSLVPINDQKAREKHQPHYVTNEKIAQFNAEVTRIAQEKQVILLNVAEGLTNEDGILPYDASTDGVHFTRAWYQQWFSYIKTHTVDPERLEAAR